MREPAINEQCVNRYNDSRYSSVQCYGKIDCDPLLYRKGILDRVVSQGEVLMKWFDSVQGIETEHKDTSQEQMSAFLLPDSLSEGSTHNIIT